MQMIVEPGKANNKDHIPTPMRPNAIEVTLEVFRKLVEKLPESVILSVDPWEAGRKRSDKVTQVVNLRMVIEPSIYRKRGIKYPQDAVKIITRELATYDKEVFAVLNLKNDGRPINFNICSVGTLDAAMSSPAIMAESGILTNASGIQVFHTHPSGNLKPGRLDKNLTRKLIAASELMGFKLLDYVIIGGSTDKIYSFRESGMIDKLKPGY